MSYSYSSSESNTNTSSTSSTTSDDASVTSTGNVTAADTSAAVNPTSTVTNYVTSLEDSSNSSTLSVATSVSASTTATAVDESLLPTDADLGDRVVIDSSVYEFTSSGWVKISDGQFLRFPSNPEPQMRYSIGNKTWEFDGYKWVLVYVGPIEDQDEYVKKETVSHLEYFGVVDGDVKVTHDLYGDEIDSILNMLNKGPSIYETAGSPLVVATGRNVLRGDDSGVEGDNFQVVNMGIDLRTITSLGEIDIKDIYITGKVSPIVLEPTTYSAMLSGRPSDIGYSWTIRKILIDGTYTNVTPEEARFISPSNRSYAEILFREENNYHIEVRAQIKRQDSLGNVVIDNEISATYDVTASDSLPNKEDSPNARSLSNWHDINRAEAPNGYLFYKRSAVFLNQDGTNPVSPIMNFSSQQSHGLHFVFNALDDIQSNTQTASTYNGFLMVHESVMNERLQMDIQTIPNTDPMNPEYYDISDYDNLLIGRPSDNTTVDYGQLRGSPYQLGDNSAVPPHYGWSGYNYRGLAILDPFRDRNSLPRDPDQADGVSFNSYDSPDLSKPLLYIDASKNTLETTIEVSEAVTSSYEILVNKFGDVTFPNAVLENRFTRGYLQSVTEIVENVKITTIHFFKDPKSSYFITNAYGTKPNQFDQIWIYDCWVSEEFSISIAASDKFDPTNDTIEPPFLNYQP